MPLETGYKVADTKICTCVQCRKTYSSQEALAHIVSQCFNLTHLCLHVLLLFFPNCTSESIDLSCPHVYNMYGQNHTALCWSISSVLALHEISMYQYSGQKTSISAKCY